MTLLTLSAEATVAPPSIFLADFASDRSLRFITLGGGAPPSIFLKIC